MSIWISLTKIDGNRIIVNKDKVYSVEEMTIPDKSKIGSQEKQTKVCVVTMIPLEGITYGDPLMVKDDYTSICNRL